MDKAYEIQPGQLADVPLKLIDPDPEQPRKTFDEDYINNELAPSIKKKGVIQPIVVRTNPEQPGRFFIVAGENRWRASKIAKVKTIPAMLREVEGLDKLIIQLQENHQRRNLNPMEWSLALQEMNKKHGLKQADIEKTLKENGVPFGRSYISNMIRLLELPEWAQDLISNNAITASHGKFLLQAMASEKVMGLLREKFEEEDWQPTTIELQRDIYFKFGKNHTDLTQSWITPFDYRIECVKTGCQKIRKVSHPETGDSTFCLDQECHAMKKAETKRQETAQSKEKQERDHSGEGCTRSISFDDEGRVDVEQQELKFDRDYRLMTQASFDTAGCEGCKHLHVATWNNDTEHARAEKSCFLVTCFIEKEDIAKRAKRLVKQYITDSVTKKLLNNGDLAVRLLAWCGAGTPEVRTYDEGEHITFGDCDFGNEEESEEVLFKTGMTSIRGFLNASPEQFSEVAAYAVTTLVKRDQLDLSLALNITIDDYRINEHYLAEHTEEELSAMLEAIEWKPGTLAEFYNAQETGHVDHFIKQHVDIVGVPKAIRFAYEHLTKED